MGSAFSATGKEGDIGRVMAEQYRLPIKHRRLVVLEGFPRYTDRSLILGKLNEYASQVQLAIRPEDYNSQGRWLFGSNSAA